MIETRRWKDGTIIDKDGKRLQETAEIFRANQRLRQGRAEQAKEPLDRATKTRDRISQFMRSQKLIEEGVAPADARVATPEEVEKRLAEYELASAEIIDLGKVYGMALDRHKAGMYDAHQHFIANGGNQGPYVDAALEDANEEMERRGEPPVNR